METIHIPGGVNGFYHLLFVDVRGKRQLHDKTVNLPIPVQTINGFQQNLLPNILFEADQCRGEPHLLTIPDLVGYIGLTPPVMPYENGCQMRRPSTRRLDFADFRRNLRFDVGSNFLTVNNFHWFTPF